MPTARLRRRWAAVFLLLPQPAYTGPSKIVTLHSVSLPRVLEDASRTNMAWLIMLYANWSPLSLQLGPLFADLSLECVACGDRPGRGVGRARRSRLQ